MAAVASFDSAARCDAPRCMPETRVAIQDEMIGWACQPTDKYDDSERLMWLHGPAGSGKTAIMGSISQTCHTLGTLAANYYFSIAYGTAYSRTKAPFIATLTYQLIQHKCLQSLRIRILAAIEHNPAIFEQRLDTQLEQLLLQPLREELSQPPPDLHLWPKVILIDGLDEVACSPTTRSTSGSKGMSDGDEQVEILHILTRAASQPSPSFPFRIIVASRPERPIRHFFRDRAPSYLFTTRELSDHYKPDEDIALYLNASLSEIARRYDMPSTWVHDELICTLVQNASGQFIYAATVVRFLETPSRHPSELLKHVMNIHPAKNELRPFSTLDRLYESILMTSPDPLQSVHWIWASRESHDARRPWSLVKFLETVAGEAEYLMGNLCSLVSVPGTTSSFRGENTPPFRVYHKSLLDYLNDPRRCDPELYLTKAARDRFSISCFFRVLESE